MSLNHDSISMRVRGAEFTFRLVGKHLALRCCNRSSFNNAHAFISPAEPSHVGGGGSVRERRSPSESQ